MKSTILPQIRATLDELSFCRLTKKEETRRQSLSRGLTRIDFWLQSNKSRDLKRLALSKILESVRHVEAWMEEGTTKRVKNHVNNLQIYYDTLEVEVEEEMRNNRFLARLISLAKTTVSFLFWILCNSLIMIVKIGSSKNCVFTPSHI